jgi:hypothetical protein
MQIQTGGDKKFCHRFKGGKPHHPSELAMEIAYPSVHIIRQAVCDKKFHRQFDRMVILFPN